MALIVVIAVMTGMQEDLRNKILESTPHLYVMEPSQSLRLTDVETVLDSVLAVDGIVGAAPFALSQVSVIRPSAAGRYQQSATLYGVDIDTTRAAPTEMERQIISGALNLAPPVSGLPPLLMGRILADRMQVFTGDTLVVASFENLNYTLGMPEPTIRPFEVTGTFTTGMYDYDLQNVYTTLEAAQELIGLEPGTTSGIGARTVDPGRAREIALDLEERLAVLAEAKGMLFPYSVVSWEEQNQALFSALKLEKIAMGVILFLIVLVAAFNIVSTLVMVVADRTREIGILKAMGMTRRGILRVFVLQGAWIGMTGTLIGTLGGVLLAWVQGTYEVIKIPPDVYFVDHLPVSLQWTDVGMIVGGSIAVSFLATIYPALQASRLEPVDAIRHD
jgi:lipoprotein-releasing system permease protein